MVKLQAVARVTIRATTGPRTTGARRQELVKFARWWKRIRMHTCSVSVEKQKPPSSALFPKPIRDITQGVRVVTG